MNHHDGDIEIGTLIDHAAPKLLAVFSKFRAVGREIPEITEGTVNRMDRQSQIFKLLFYEFPVPGCPGIKMYRVGPELHSSKAVPGYFFQSFMETEIFKSPGRKGIFSFVGIY
jgi:hypothetical protein